ncbi:MAG TPA: FkbM family methyltransferase [Cyclobacteriaceae bacterium]|nr:FkbM family methyltransferase [Cyclobacteriaceae bacterium]
MARFKDILGKLLPYWIIDKFNEIRGVSYQESEEIIERRVNFYKSFLSAGDLVFDVGSNYGSRIPPLLHLSCKVVAVEPLPDCCRYLKHKYGDKIHLENLCLSSENGESDLFIGKVNVLSTLSSDFIKRTTESGRFEKDTWSSNSIRVKVLTLDELMRKYGIPKFIKIDTEGYEIEVIKGLSKSVPYLSFEYTLPEFEKELMDILNILAKKGEFLINISSGETMKFVSEKWMSLSEFHQFLKNNSQTVKGWGDVYINYEHYSSSEPQKES